MVDLPDTQGKMCDWDTVKAVDGAFETLESLSRTARIYVATGAEESTELDISKALERVGLSQFISGYFCKANLGVSKGDPGFLPAIVEKLERSPSCMAMVGDDLEKDILPALAAGIKAIWLTESGRPTVPAKVHAVSHLRELYIAPNCVSRSENTP